MDNRRIWIWKPIRLHSMRQKPYHGNGEIVIRNNCQMIRCVHSTHCVRCDVVLRLRHLSSISSYSIFIDKCDEQIVFWNRHFTLRQKRREKKRAREDERERGRKRKSEREIYMYTEKRYATTPGLLGFQFVVYFSMNIVYARPTAKKEATRFGTHTTNEDEAEMWSIRG